MSEISSAGGLSSNRVMNNPARAFPRLLCDIGGTNARLAWQRTLGAPLENIRVLKCMDYATLEDAITSYLASSRGDHPHACAIAIASPIVGDEVAMTNHGWAFSITKLRGSLGLTRLEVLNDFTALALALPSLTADQLRQVGRGTRAPGAAIGLIGPGTGLGISGLVPAGPVGRYLPLPSQGGHATLAAQSEEEFRVVEFLQRRHGHASVERAVSGRGLVDLYDALGEIEACAFHTTCDPADVVAMATSDPSGLAGRAVNMFCAFLGGAAGDLALYLCAKGGVFIGGGVVPHLGTLFEQSPFRQRFEDKGCMRAYVEDIATFVVDTPVSPALTGASIALDQTVGY